MTKNITEQAKPFLESMGYSGFECVPVHVVYPHLCKIRHDPASGEIQQCDTCHWSKPTRYEGELYCEAPIPEHAKVLAPFYLTRAGSGAICETWKARQVVRQSLLSRLCRLLKV